MTVLFFSGGFLRLIKFDHFFRDLICGFTLVALMNTAGCAEDGPGPSEKVIAEAGWKFRVAAQNLPQIDNLAMADDGSLYATQELPFGAGKVIRLGPGKITPGVFGLSLPGGFVGDG